MGKKLNTKNFNKKTKKNFNKKISKKSVKNGNIIL